MSSRCFFGDGQAVNGDVATTRQAFIAARGSTLFRRKFREPIRGFVTFLLGSSDPQSWVYYGPATQPEALLSRLQTTEDIAAAAAAAAGSHRQQLVTI